jgi:hypothetical protein
MNTQNRLFTGAVALALAATSVLFTASNASARPYDDDRYNGRDNNGAAGWKHDRDVRHHDRDVRRRDRNDQYDRFNRYDRYDSRWSNDDRNAWSNDRDDYRYNRRNVFINRPSQRYQTYPSNGLVRLPDGCRRVVYRDRTYYTRDNYQYYTYDSDRRGYIVVNFPGLRLGF